MKQLRFAVFLLLTCCIAKAQSPVKIRDIRAGKYMGSALNTTANAKGKVLFEIYAIDPTTHRLRAYFAASDGLTGDAWLSGSLGTGNSFHLSGKLLSWNMVADGHLTPAGTIAADYLLDGESQQKGNFEVHYESALPQVDERLVGSWETGDALAPQVDPVTGETSGVSFSEARQLEILPDGGFRNVQSHEHCGGRGFSRCCSTQFVIEEGRLTIEPSRMVFDVEKGQTIAQDRCNPALSGQVAAKKQKVILGWTMKSGDILCLQNGSSPATCYRKQS